MVSGIRASGFLTVLGATAQAQSGTSNHQWAIRGGAKGEVEIYDLGDAGARCRGEQRGQLLATDRDEGASRPGVEKLHGHRLGSELKVNPTAKGRRQGEKRIRVILISESDATCALRLYQNAIWKKVRDGWHSGQGQD